MIFISLQDIVRFLDLGEHHDGDGSVLWGLLADFDGNHHDFCLRHFSRASASTSVQNSGEWSRSRHMLWALLLGCSSFWWVYMSCLISTNLYISIRLYNLIFTSKICLSGIITTITGFVIVCLDYKIPKLAAKYILIEKPFVKEDVYTSEHRKSFATLPQLKVGQTYWMQCISSLMTPLRSKLRP